MSRQLVQCGAGCESRDDARRCIWLALSNSLDQAAARVELKLPRRHPYGADWDVANSSDAASRAASHAPRADVASTSKPSTPASVATCRTIDAGSTVLRVEKLTANEDDGTWRDIVALSGSCVGVRRSTPGWETEA